MKNKIIFGIAAMLVAIATTNVNISLQKNSATNVTLNRAEASADTESPSEWWNKKTHMCQSATCSVSFGVPPVVITKYGTYQQCNDGSAEAHCWNCETTCDVL